MYYDSLQVLTLSVLFCVCQNHGVASEVLRIDRQEKVKGIPFDLPKIRSAIKASRNSVKDREILQQTYPNQEKHVWEEELSKKHVPSLMSEMYSKMQNVDSTLPVQCGQPGTPGHVVRSLQNKGEILHQDDSSVVTELRFSLNGVLFEHENIKSSVVYIPPPLDTIQGRWTSNIEGRTYQYKIFVIPNNKWRHFLHRIKQQPKTRPTPDNLTHRVHYKTAVDVAEHFGSLIGKRNVTINRSQASDIQSESLDVLTLVAKWREELSKRQGYADVESRAILIITETITSSFAKQAESCPKQKCIVSEAPKLVVVSVDQTQCPEKVHIVNEVSREKREVGTNKKHDDTKPSSGEPRDGLHRPRQSAICQRYPMWIDFKDIGWSDWVIAPTRFQAYRCAGDCPFPLSGALNGTNHAMLMTMMNSVEPGKSQMPCCVPTKLKSVSLLYLDNADNVVLRQYEDMVIESCGCR